MADVQVTIGADLSEMLGKLSEASGVTKKEAAAMSKSLKGAFKAAEKESAKARKEMKRLQGQTKSNDEAFRSAKEAAGIFGGQLGAAAEMADKARNSFKAAAGGAGSVTLAVGAGAIAAIGYVVALQKIAVGTVEAVRAGREWIADLKEAGVVIDRDVVASIEEMNTALDGLTLQSKALGVEVVAGIVDPFMQAADTAALLLTGFDRLGESAPILTSAVSALAGAIVTGLVPGLTTLSSWAETVAIVFPEATAAVDEFRNATKETTLVLDLNKDSMSDLLDLTDALTEVRRRAKIASMEAAEAARANTIAARAAAAEAKKAAAQHLKDLKEEERKILDVITLSMALGAARVAASEAAADAAEDFDKAIQDLQDAIDGLKEKTFEIMSKAIAGMVGQLQGPLFNALSNINAIQQQNTEDELARIQAVQAARENAGAAQLQSLKERETELQKQMIRQFKAEKRASVAEAIINGAVAATMALGVLPPFGTILAATIAASTATQVGVIQNQKPPTFPTGGMVGDRVDGDHVLVGAQRNEAILTGRGVDAAGGAAGVAAMNAGAGGPTHIEIHLPGAVIARSITSDRTTQRAIIHIVESEMRKKGIT